MPLAYYSRAATEEFWSEHWGGQDVEALLDVARRSPLTTLVESTLPRAGIVVEAGCGLGQYVILLRERGHRAIGADWSVDALLRARSSAADVPLAAMDLAALAMRDGAAAAYLSLGVVEHDVAGPDRLLAEARRVLAPRGRLVLSVPYLNGVRRLFRPAVARRQRAVRAAGGEFYQYAFTRPEVRRFLDRAGFDVLSLVPYDPARILRKALRRVARGNGARPAPAKIAPRPADGGAPAAAPAPPPPHARAPAAGIARRLLYTEPALRLLGHMILAVADKR